MSDKCNTTANCVKSEDGEILTEEKKIRERWREHFQEIMNVRNDVDENERLLHAMAPAEYDLEDINMESVTNEEIIQAIKSMKNNRAAGIDNIVAEMWKVTGATTVHELHIV